MGPVRVIAALRGSLFGVEEKRREEVEGAVMSVAEKDGVVEA
jgi:hypothetical protein